MEVNKFFEDNKHRIFFIYPDEIIKLLDGKEQIKEIPNFDGKYGISSHGYVFNQYTGKKLKPYLLKKFNHFVHHLWIYGSRRQIPLHMLLAEAFLPNPNNYKHVIHLNGDKRDNRISNLLWYNKANTNRYNKFNETEQRKINKFIERKTEFNEKQKTKYLKHYEYCQFEKNNFLNRFNKYL